MNEPDRRPGPSEAAQRGAGAKPPGASPGPPGRRPKPPVVGVEQVAVRCGHVVPFELFEPKKDKYRDDRRKKLTDRDCSACRIKAQEEKQAAEMEAARQRRAARPKREAAAEVKDRLPNGSRFDVLWDADKGQWGGTLTVPAAGAEPAVFTASAGGVFRLLRTLDGMYRDSLQG